MNHDKIWYITIQYDSKQFNTIEYDKLLYEIIYCKTIEYNTITKFKTIQNKTNQVNLIQ